MRNRTYNALALTGVGVAEIFRLPIEPLRAGEVRVEIDACGLCSGEVADYSGVTGDPFIERKFIGHEFTGAVVEVGERVVMPRKGFPFEDQPPYVEKGDRVLGWVRGGAMAQLVTTWEHALRPVGSWSDSRRYPFTLGEPMMCLVSAIDQASPRLGDHVVILGAGYMALTGVAILSHMGLGSLTVAARRAEARQLAFDVGATHTIDLSSEEQLVEDVASITGGDMADVVWESTGAYEPVNFAHAVARPSGKVSTLSFHAGQTVPVKLGVGQMMAHTVPSGHTRDLDQITWSFERGLRLAASHRLDLDRLVTHTGGLSDAPELFRLAADRPDGYVKAAVVMA